MTKIGTDIHLARQLLMEGQLVAVPTETVYGLAGNALDTRVVSEIFRVKDRPSFDPLIVHTDSLVRVKDLTGDIPVVLARLADRFMPGPLTLLLPKTEKIPDLVTSGSPKVAIRIPDHPLTLTLLGQLDFPLAAPSANPFGYISPTSAQHVFDQLNGKIPYILDGGQCSIGLESTIVDYDQGQVVILRKGGIAIEEIEKVAGKVKVMESSTSRPSAPGMLDQHYAPAITLTLDPLAEVLTRVNPAKIGLLVFNKIRSELSPSQQLVLSPDSSLQEAAQNFFSFLRRLDKMDLDIIVAETVPEVGLGQAINDKLKRAARKTNS